MVPGLLYAAYEVAERLELRELDRAAERLWSRPGGEVLFRVGPGSTAGVIANRLEAARVIEDRRVFLHAVGRQDAGARLQAGLYRFDGPLSPNQVVARMAAGDVARNWVTLPEGLDIRDSAVRLARAGMGAADELEDAFRDPQRTQELLRDLDPKAEDLEGYLFPSTYDVPPGARPEEIARLLANRFREHWEGERAERAAALGMTLREVATLASIIEKETGAPAERPRIAGVFRNRLDRGMRLQSDPTVLFAMRASGDFGNDIRRRDLRMASPYNTYYASGLPPGPISSFGIAALDAALHPEETDFLYFVSKNDGTHQFSRTLREHNRAVQRFQRPPTQ